MAKYYSFFTQFFVSDTVISVVSTYGAAQISTPVTRGVSEDTDLAVAIVAHKNAFLSLDPSSTSPACYVDIVGSWIILTPSATVTSNPSTINVPTGNSGDLILHDDGGTYTMEYRIDAGSWTSFTDNDTITVTDGQTLAFKASTVTEQDFANGSVEDTDTGRTLDAYSLMNSTPAP